MKNLLSLRGNRKPQSALLGVAFLAVFTLLAAFIIGCDKDTPLGVDHQAGPEKQISAAMNGDRIFTGKTVELGTRELLLASFASDSNTTASSTRLESDLKSFYGMPKNDVLSGLTPAQGEAASIPQIN